MIDIAVFAGFFIVSFVVATLLIRLGVPRLQSDSAKSAPLPESRSRRAFDLRSTGFWIGFFETLLVFVLVVQAEFSALAIIIGAKEFVRKDQIVENPSYYLLGTLVNLSVAVLSVLAAKAILTTL
ncbi:MAG TPA: hypothetical protein PKJ99_04640 [Thermoanaerobaculales bacterium]|mgnify:CR=1 FL=1|nr:hypothetical protein [Thermoanaerobaculales bacterium]